MAVSVVLNGASSSARVSERTRARILEAAERLRYRRNAVAFGLSRSRMDTIGLAAQIDSRETNVYFLEVLSGILAAAVDRGQSIKVFSVSSWRDDEPRIHGFCDGRIDGLILVGPDMAPGFAEALAQAAPFVTIHANGPAPHGQNLDVDSAAGSAAATRHLVELGHRRIYHFAGPAHLLASRERIAGFRACLDACGIQHADDWVFPGAFDPESGRRSVAEMLARGRRALPTGITCGNDAVAYGCMEALAARGIRVPEDISVIGFDDTLMARMTIPALTTLRQPFRGMAARALELLLAEIGEEVATPGRDHAAGPRNEIWPVELVARASTARPRRGEGVRREA